MIGDAGYYLARLVMDRFVGEKEVEGVGPSSRLSNGLSKAQLAH